MGGQKRAEAKQERDLENGGKRIISWEEIKKHDKPNDCWVVYEGTVYDVTEFVPNHPGGAAIWWQGGGRDITILYNISHPPRITLESHLAKYGKLVGEADGPEVKGAPEYDFQSPFWVELKIKCWEKLYDHVKNVKGYDGVKYYKVTYGEKDLFLVLPGPVSVEHCYFRCRLPLARLRPANWRTFLAGHVLLHQFGVGVVHPWAFDLRLQFHDA